MSSHRSPAAPPFARGGQQRYHLGGAHHLGSLIQDLVEERDRAPIGFDPGPLVVYGHSRAQGVGGTNRSAEPELPLQSTQERPGRSRRVNRSRRASGTTA